MADILPRLEQENERDRAATPLKHPARLLNLALIRHLSEKTSFPDKSLHSHLKTGMKITGQIPTTGTMVERTRNATLTAAQLAKKREANNASVLRWLYKSQPDEDLSLALWNKTMAEVKNGWLSPPIKIDDVKKVEGHLTPRFAIR